MTAAAVSGGSRRNREYADDVHRRSPTTSPKRACACVSDATTSGGLLIAVAPEDAPRPCPARSIGRILAGEPGAILVQ